MAVDYVIDYPCKVKEALPLDELIPLIKRRDHCRYILAGRLQEGESEDKALNSTIEFQVRKPDGVTTREEKISDALESTKMLDDLEKHCIECPVSQGQDFGCYCVINYPISGKAEKWLAGLAKQAVTKGPPASLILDFILDQGLDGGSITKMRAAGDMFLELRKPIEIVVEGSLHDKKKVVNTDQILRMVIDIDAMRSPHMKGLLELSGGLSEMDIKPQCGCCQLTATVTGQGGKISWLAYDLPDNDTDDHSIAGLKKFFRALFIAYATDSEVSIDL
jgi:hypothetical protein